MSETAPIDLEELKRLLAKATPGPWRLSNDDPIEICQMGLAVKICSIEAPHSNELAFADAQLIVTIRNSATALIEELEAMREYYDANEVGSLHLLDKARSSVEAIRRTK